MSSVRIDERNFVYVNEVKIGRFFPGTSDLEFVDKDSFRCRQRGTKFVRIKIDQFYGELSELSKKLNK